MTDWALYGGLLALAGAAVLVLWWRRRVRKTMAVIGDMLDRGINGTFAEEVYDESRLSALEAKFARYLAANALASGRVSAEKDTIQSLIGDISHQTKTPIANLLLYSELLREEDLSPAAREQADAVYGQAEKLRFLIDALVKLSRLEHGIITPSPRPGPVRPLLEQAAAQYAPAARQKGLTLTALDTDAQAVFDPKWTAEALGNLVDNAVKYTDRGGVTLSAASYELFTRIDVADTGPGIPEADHPRIFSRFYRGEQGQDRDGVGIGLYLAREIVASQGGYIKLSSAPGDGAVFSLFLPR